ncbi:MAG: DUF4147 domain-containing protein [Dehalococcoidia bacterium]|nr:DUF4147 domain-containing protein [Dehalococcoidia bacterium]
MDEVSGERTQQARALAVQLLRPALAAVSPGAFLRTALRWDGHLLTAGPRSYDLDRKRRVTVVGAGKASAGLAEALQSLLGERITTGVVVVPQGIQASTGRVRLQTGGHPLPDAGGVAGARAALELAASAGPEDLLVCLLTGGASALWPTPTAGLSLEDKQLTTALLVRSGAAIGEINTVRKHLSRIKGGGLARATGGAALLSLIISDVVGDDLATIGSGPTAPDATTYADAIAVLERHGLWERLPGAVRQHLQAGQAGLAPETPKPGDPCFQPVQNLLLGNGSTALAAAAATARAQGLRPITSAEPVLGEARQAGRRLGRTLRELAHTQRGACFLAAGEPTVTVRGTGIGGRTLELALGAAQELSGTAGVALLACATDGQDGPSGAAGAIVDGVTIQRAAGLGLDVERSLMNNDTLPLFHALGDLIVTGPTGTNVADIYLGVIL